MIYPILCEAQNLSINSPVSAQATVWAGGTTQNIEWSGGTGDSVSIIFIDEAGNSVIIDSTQNDGLYEWIVADGLTRPCQIVIVDNETDTAGFTRENSAGGIYSERPSMGEYWRRGSTYEISWTDNLDEDLKIVLYERSAGGTGEPTISIMDITTSTPSNGSYSWSIPGNVDTGDYQLRLEGVDHPMTYVYSSYFNIIKKPTGCADAYEPNDFLADSYDHAFSDSIGGLVSYNDSTAGTFHVTGDDDFYTINIDAPGTLGLDLVNVPDNARLVLYTWSGEGYDLLGSSDNAGDENITVHLDEIGKAYYVGVEGPDGSSSCSVYTLYATWTADACVDLYEPNNVFENPNTSAFSTDIGGTFSKIESIEGTIQQSGDWDHYLITATVTGTLNINLTNVPDEFDLQLYNENQNFLASSETSGDENINYEITVPGDYIIIVGSFVGAYDCSPYLLTVDWTTEECPDTYEPNDSIQAPDSTAFTEAIGGIFYRSELIEGTIHKPGDWDHYRIRVDIPGELDVVLSNVSDSIDLQLYNSEGDFVTGSFNPGDDHIRPHLVDPGFYYIIVGSQEGAYNCTLYSLEVRWFPDNCEDLYEPNDQIEFPDSTAFTSDIGSINTKMESITGSIHQSGDYDHYLVDLRVPGLLEIDLNNVQSKIDLQLYNGDGYVTGSYTSGNEHIGIEVSDTGSYVVIVGSDEGVFSCSPYTLSINWEVDPIIQVTPGTGQASSLGDTLTFSVLSNTMWSVTADTSWLSVSRNDDEIIAVVQKNTDLVARDATMTVSAAGVEPVLVQVMQEAGSCEQNLVPGALAVPAGTETRSIKVDYNDVWIVNENEDWVSTSVIGDSIHVLIDENETTEVRIAEIEVVGGECSGVVTITQEAGDCNLMFQKDTLNFSSEGGVQKITVSSNIAWFVNEFSNWITTKITGDSLTITCAGNGTTKDRMAPVVVIGGECTDTLRVVQLGAECFISVLPDSLTVGHDAGTADFVVDANVNWTVGNNINWLTVNKLEDTIRISYNSNGTIFARTAILTVSGEECSREITLMQEGMEPVLQVNTTTLSLDPEAGSNTAFNITSNTTWTIEESIPWLDVEVTSGIGSRGVIVLATGTNNTGQSRSDTVRVTGAGIAHQIIVTQESVTGIEPAPGPRFMLYPNPAGSELTVRLNKQSDGLTVRVYNSLGREVLIQRHDFASVFTVNLQALPVGVYLMELNDGEGRTVKTFMKE